MAKRKNNLSPEQMFDIIDRSITLVLSIKSHLEPKVHLEQMTGILDVMKSELIILQFAIYNEVKSPAKRSPI
ncbi:hypothetical protein [Syntrophomonas wolfei]|uniref:hypothetical protein n=1 Tax=Syntrophomonas wolfei TaxID=863 RepID=UPI00059C789D|nr:hypothetical protein [Syntrophomonas wolfei]